MEWEKPKTTKGLRSFLGLASYYRKFVRDFAKIAKPLSDLFEKSVSEIWDEHCYRAFGELKRRLTSAPVLKFLEFKKPFEVHTDASDFTIGGVLKQEGRPVAFESKKLSDVERRWPTHEKEMWAVVHCLKLWQHYLGLEYTKVYTDNVSVRYFKTQPKITPKQWRWGDVLACFNVDLIHKPGRDNVVPDALSRRQELRIIFTGEVSRPSHNLSANGRVATSRDTGVTNLDLGASRGSDERLRAGRARRSHLSHDVTRKLTWSCESRRRT